MDVPGRTFIEIVLRGGTKLDQDLNLVYDGPTRFDPEFPMLIALYEGGDFEAQSTWYLGLSGPACVRVMRLVGEGGSPRLVIDVES